MSSWEHDGNGEGVMAMPSVEFVVDPGVPADAGRFFAAGTSLIALLDDLSEAPLPWIIESLQMGSAAARVGLAPDSTDRDTDFAVSATNQLADGFRQLDADAPLPEAWTPDAVSHARAFSQLVAPPGATARGRLFIVGGELAPNAAFDLELTDSAVQRLIDLRPQISEVRGSVRGRIMGVNFSRGNRASVKPAVGRTVQVSFDDSLRGPMKDHVLDNVLLSGEVRRTYEGATYHIRAQSMDVIGSDQSFKASDLFGIDPDFANGLDPDEYLARLRGEA